MMLDDAAFVEHDRAESGCVEFVDPVIVRDIHARSDLVRFACVIHRYADLRALFDRLLRDGQRSARISTSSPVSE